MTRLERVIRRISDLRDFYLQVKKLQKPRRGRKTYTELGRLAGTWSDKDAKTFASHRAAFRKVDRERGK